LIACSALSIAAIAEEANDADEISFFEYLGMMVELEAEAGENEPARWLDPLDLDNPALVRDADQARKEQPVATGESS
jgi:hypothetical protein